AGRKATNIIEGGAGPDLTTNNGWPTTSPAAYAARAAARRSAARAGSSAADAPQCSHAAAAAELANAEPKDIMIPENANATAHKNAGPGPRFRRRARARAPKNAHRTWSR